MQKAGLLKKSMTLFLKFKNFYFYCFSLITRNIYESDYKLVSVHWFVMLPIMQVQLCKLVLNILKFQILIAIFGFSLIECKCALY